MYRHWIALLGIPVAVVGALCFDIEIPRLVYGGARPPYLVPECVSLIGLVALVLMLRARLSGADEPTGLCRDVLDFLALRRWRADAGSQDTCFRGCCSRCCWSARPWAWSSP